MTRKHQQSVDSGERHDTLRHTILSLLEEGPRTAKDLSAEVGIPEKDVPGHLEHIRRTVTKAGRQLVIIPSECRKCGFVFRKREKFTKPGKCPVCRGESIREPRYTIDSGDR